MRISRHGLGPRFDFKRLAAFEVSREDVLLQPLQVVGFFFQPIRMLLDEFGTDPTTAFNQGLSVQVFEFFRVNGVVCDGLAHVCHDISDHGTANHYFGFHVVCISNKEGRPQRGEEEAETSPPQLAPARDERPKVFVGCCFIFRLYQSGDFFTVT